jgi:multidrug efflux pump subunit AcrB
LAQRGVVLVVLCLMGWRSAIMPGPAGEFVGSIAVSVILAIVASLFFSLTVIPVFAARC